MFVGDLLAFNLSMAGGTTSVSRILMVLELGVTTCTAEAILDDCFIGLVF